MVQGESHLIHGMACSIPYITGTFLLECVIRTLHVHLGGE